MIESPELLALFVDVLGEVTIRSARAHRPRLVRRLADDAAARGALLSALERLNLDATDGAALVADLDGDTRRSLALALTDGAFLADVQRVADGAGGAA